MVKQKSLVVVEIPEELKLENHARRPLEAIFDRLDLVISFRAGKGNIGAVIKSFVDAIAVHDMFAVNVETKMIEVDELRYNYRKKNRLFRNLDSAWNVVLDNAKDFNEYKELKPKMKNMEHRLKIVTDPVIKAQLESTYARFQQIESKCSKQEIIHEAYVKAREERDESIKILVLAEKQLSQLRELEKLHASLISDDHILADDMKKSLSALFPNVHVGFILSRINGEDVEHKPFEEIMEKLKKARSPHRSEFLRYDYRFDPFDGEWYSLQQLRDKGVCIENPLLNATNFIYMAGMGKVNEIRALLARGEDPDCIDLTGNSALVVAAANRHVLVLEELLKAGADINICDKNIMTPLLYCINRGLLDMVRILMDYGADKTWVDKNGRGTLFYAVMSGNIELVKLFIRRERQDTPDRLWGFTPLHVAANQGSMEIIEYLLTSGCSIYRLDKRGRTAEIVARESGNLKVAQRLEDERINAPGQFISSVRDLNIWVGDESALEVTFCAEVDITGVLYIRHQATQPQLPSNAMWLTKQKTNGLVQFLSILIEQKTMDELMLLAETEQGEQDTAPASRAISKRTLTAENSRVGMSASASMRSNSMFAPKNNEAWEMFQHELPVMLSFAKQQAQREGSKRLLICDEDGRAMAPSVAAALMLLIGNIRISDSKKMIEEARAGIMISKDIFRGLDAMQRRLDAKNIQRMNDRLRDTTALSIAF